MLRTFTAFARLALIAYGLAHVAHAQTFVVQDANCRIFVHFTAVNQSSPTSPNAGFDNRTTGCTTWNMAISVSGFSSVTVALQSAPDNAGVPGTWVTYAGGNIISASPHNANPIVTATEDFVWIVGYNPWVRVIMTAATGSGSVNGGAFGWPIPSAGAAAAASQNVVIVGPLGQALMAASIPVVIASNQTAVPVTFSGNSAVNLVQVNGVTALTGGTNGSQGVGGLSATGAVPSGNPLPQGLIDGGGNVIIPEYCTKRFAFSNPSTGSTQLVAVSGSTTIRVCHISFSGDTITTAQLVTGTGAGCTSPTAETGIYGGAGGGLFGLFEDWGANPLITTAAKTLCLSLSAGFTGGGVIIYSQR